MEKRGTASLPLHKGKAPRWLFSRMKKLGGSISKLIILEHGLEEYLKRLSDPYWFQAFGCVLGFDWHSSGLTTTTMGALKEALDEEEHGIKVVGGKGKNSRKTPQEINEVTFNLKTSKLEEIKKSSKMSAKVDNSCIQDRYRLYHHTVTFSEKGDWCVIQQGMDESTARRYHWLSKNVQSFVEEPQDAICTQKKRSKVLNLTSKESKETRGTSVDLVKDDPKHLKRYLKPKKQKSLTDFTEQKESPCLQMPKHHMINKSDLTERSINQLKKAYEVQPENFQELVEIKGIGPKSLRSLALISEIVYGSKNSWEDPAKYSFTVGGKDGTPYPIDKNHYDEVINELMETVKKTELGGKSKKQTLKRLNKFLNQKTT